MKAKFYLILDLNLVINLEHLSSYQKAIPVNNPAVDLQCCLVVGKSIFWCHISNWDNINNVLNRNSLLMLI